MIEEANEKAKASTKSEQSLILWIAMGGLLAVSLALGILTARLNLRLNELSARLDTSIAAQGETLQHLSRNIEVGGPSA